MSIGHAPYAGIIVVSLYTLRLEDAAIYASNKLAFVLTSPFFRGYKLRAFIRFTGACPPVISRTPANNVNAIGERERAAFRCMRGRRKTLIVTAVERQREREREKETAVYCSVVSLRIDMKRFEMLVVPFLPCARPISPLI